MRCFFEGMWVDEIVKVVEQEHPYIANEPRPKGNFVFQLIAKRDPTFLDVCQPTLKASALSDDLHVLKSKLRFAPFSGEVPFFCTTPGRRSERTLPQGKLRLESGAASSAVHLTAQLSTQIAQTEIKGVV